MLENLCGTNHINRYIIYGEGTSIELRVIEIKYQKLELKTFVDTTKPLLPIFFIILIDYIDDYLNTRSTF